MTLGLSQTILQTISTTLQWLGFYGGITSVTCAPTAWNRTVARFSTGPEMSLCNGSAAS
jgi:hypothetical protein